MKDSRKKPVRSSRTRPGAAEPRSSRLLQAGGGSRHNGWEAATAATREGIEDIAALAYRTQRCKIQGGEACTSSRRARGGPKFARTAGRYGSTSGWGEGVARSCRDEGPPDGVKTRIMMSLPTSAPLLLPLLDTRGALGKMEERRKNQPPRGKFRAPLDRMKWTREEFAVAENGRLANTYHCNMVLATLVGNASGRWTLLRPSPAETVQAPVIVPPKPGRHLFRYPPLEVFVGQAAAPPGNFGIWERSTLSADKYVFQNLGTGQWITTINETNNHLGTVNGANNATVFAVESAGGNEFVIKLPNADSVWEALFNGTSPIFGRAGERERASALDICVGSQAWYGWRAPYLKFECIT
ncbi:hypothetical protein B0H13DRAFT_1888378 [Mycena leptocephala]|nr:hypothetical protein B0H13DRAFT_1888378 [Mycena leptocephala]